MKFYKYKKTLLFILAGFVFSCFNSYAAIIIKGNERINDEIVKSYIVKKSFFSDFTKQEIDQSLKKLFESELFIDVKIFNDNNNIVIDVKENPVVSEIKIVGNKKIEDEALLSELSLKKRSIFTKFKLQSDLKRINEIYIKSGRYLVSIDPKIITKEQNRVEVIYDIKEGPRAKIEEISFVGNEAFSDSELLEEITTQPSKWFKFFSSADIYDSDRIEFDKEKLRRFYGSKGYADFSAISATAQILPSRDKFLVNFLLEEGIKYNISDIKISNHIDKFNEKILYDDILIKKGKLYNSDLIEKTVEKMTKTMSDKAFAFANIDPVLYRDRESKTIVIDFVINESLRIYIDSIIIKGNSRTLDEVIRREMRIKEGDPYNITKINRSKQRIQNLGFFEKVEFNTIRTNDPDRVIIEIEVKEKKTGELNFGVGYSTVDQATANIGLKERNLFGTGREIGVNVQRSKFSFNSDISYTKPYFLDFPVDAGFDVFRYESNKRNTLVYDQASQGAAVRFGYAITEFLGHSVSYSFRDESITNVDPNASISIKGLEGNYITSSLSQSLNYDKRDNRLDPRSGYFASASQEYSGIGGDINNIKHTGSAGFYQPIFSNNFVFKILARGGVIDGIGQDVRSNYGFFLGGNNFRGFEYAGLGPRTINPNTKSAVGGNAVGGNIYYVATAEMRFPLGLPKELGIYGVLFSENGTVKSVDSINKVGSAVADTGSLRSSYGLSIAWSSQMGSISFDFFKISKKEEFDRTQNFRFSFGTGF